MPPELDPAYAGDSVEDATRLLQAIFTPAGCGFHLDDGGMTPGGPEAPWRHRRSLLLSFSQTTVQPQRLPISETPIEGLPPLLQWAADGCGKASKTNENHDWQRLVIGGRDRPGEVEQKDFLIVPAGSEAQGDGDRTSKILLQLLAHRRSRLFGLPLARDTINVLLPHALLGSTNESGKAWFTQPALSLFYVNGRRSFRPIFSFSLFLIPCQIEKPGSSTLKQRSMTSEEIQNSVRHPWPLTTALPDHSMETFEISGPLGAYLSTVAPDAMGTVGIDAGIVPWARQQAAPLTIRKFTEAMFFALALRMTRPSRGLLPLRARKEIGDRVLTALSASRVSSVCLVADNCGAATESEHQPSPECRSLDPFDLSTLLRQASTEISEPYRLPPSMSAAREESRRLDRDFFDTDCYAMGVLPADRCVVSVGNRCAQQGFRSSALLEAGWTAYMVSGAAVATGLIRNVFRDIVSVERSKPDSIAELEREAMVDLHETYDLEITTEIYRNRYRLLRKHLGIDAEYKALSDKLEALYRETSTRFDGRSERRLTVLTWAIMILSAVIAAGTLVLIFKHGG
ncbi:MAG: hypothetical protein ACTHKT_11635 [Solirubrobacterales bacterium]